MKEQFLFQKILLQKFEELRLKNPHYSRRAFARKIGLSPGATSELFNGHRRVSARLALRIAQKLSLDPEECAEINKCFTKVNKNVIDAEYENRNYLKLTVDQFKVIADWYHFAILALMRTSEFKSNPVWISKRLGLNQDTVKQALGG